MGSVTAPHFFAHAELLPVQQAFYGAVRLTALPSTLWLCAHSSILTTTKAAGVSTLAEDARTSIGPYVTVAIKETLLRLFRHVGVCDAEIEEAEADIRRWSRGSIWIDLTPGRKNLLRLRKPWSDELPTLFS